MPSHTPKPDYKDAILKLIRIFVIIMMSKVTISHFYIVKLYVSNPSSDFRYGDVCLFSRLSTVTSQDIVLYQSNGDYCRARVLATCADLISFSGDSLVINGYTSTPALTNISELKHSDLLQQSKLSESYILLLIPHPGLDNDVYEGLIVERTAIMGKLIMMIRLRDF